MANPKPASKPQTPALPSSYEMLGMRIQKIINSTGAQTSKSALLERRPGDLPEDWDRLAIQKASHKGVAHHSGGGRRTAYTWRMCCTTRWDKTSSP